VQAADISRREFLKFIGASAGGVAAAGLLSSKFLSACASLVASPSVPFAPLAPTLADGLNLAPGFRASRLIEFGTVINSRGERFGYDNDFIGYIPLDPSVPDDGYLWVNHENVDMGLVSGDWTRSREKRFVDQELEAVGASILRVRRGSDGQWSVVALDPHNRRLDARTPIPLVAPRDIEGSRTAIGTLANCCGGVTPWRTFLSCEENFMNFFGERDHGERQIRPSGADLGWHRYYKRPPEHYGWVVEIEPATGRARKLTSLGRFAHEGATVVKAPDGRAVAYMGDDSDERCVYKFVADRPGTLETGILHVADVAAGRWIPLVRDRHPALQKKFRDQLDVLIHAREAARMVGGTPLDRPEDIEVHPTTGHVFVALTNNKRKGRPHGSLLRIVEHGDDPCAERFEASTWAAGGAESGFSCPDNLAFDRRGNLWFTTDISGREIGRGHYEPFGNNSLFYMPLNGPYAGRAMRVASAPVDAEFTGPCFAPDGSALFLSVQHPGEHSKGPGQYTSHWPTGDRPLPGVVTISGATFEALLG
jgi:secreted PhoX family phosphatase